MTDSAFNTTIVHYGSKMVDMLDCDLPGQIYRGILSIHWLVWRSINPDLPSLYMPAERIKLLSASSINLVMSICQYTSCSRIPVLLKSELKPRIEAFQLYQGHFYWSMLIYQSFLCIYIRPSTLTSLELIS